MKNSNLRGELAIMNNFGIKPNYAALGREYGIDPRTVKKYNQGYEGKPKTRNKVSKLDYFITEITDKLTIKRVTVKGVYEFMVNKYGIDTIGTYSNFIAYVKKHKLKPKSSSKGHPRNETLPGVQAQVDWKEDITLVSKYGEIFVINVFHIVLSFSRYSYLELTIQKRTEDVYRGLINGFKAFGGVPKEILFDNMSTVANTHGNQKKPTNSILKLAKDCEFKVRLCRARSPETKGTVEAKNKPIDWIRPYDGEFADLDDLIRIIKEINQAMNINVNEEMGMSPTALFYKEKEYLQPLPTNAVIEPYLCPNRYLVTSEALIRYGGNKYSVDPKLINEEVTVDTLENNLYIYYKGKLTTYHPLNENKINYKKEHYE
ncbi:MAG: IS21 family transposase, partial [Brevinema sp.]